MTPIPPSLLAPPGSSDAGGPPCALGVDEAGRGPVLGPMVYAVFFVPLSQSDALLRGGAAGGRRFDDSKALTAGARAALMRALCEPGGALRASTGWAVTALSARDLGAGMLRPSPTSSTSSSSSSSGGGGGGGGYNLNAQALDATVDLVRRVCAAGVNVREIYVDTIGQPAAYQRKLERVFPTARVTVAKKADSLYPCVSAASVCAKVTRDAALETLWRARAARGDQAAAAAAAAGEEDDGAAMAWGSGYPSDGRCVAWLRGNMHPVFGWGPECRFSWGTARDMLEAAPAKGGGVKVDWPAGEDTDTHRLTDFFADKDQDKDADELGTWFGTPVGLEAF